MATGQTLLTWMEILWPELQLQSGESDVTKGLLALNAAQDMLETHMAQYADDMYGGTEGTLSTTANQEYTTFPTGLLRVDQIDMLDDTDLPAYTLDPLDPGGSARGRWYWNVASSTSSAGKPAGWWANKNRIYWDPIPAEVYDLRYYGLVAATDITANGTFLYPDYAILPVAVLATKMLRMGVDDPTDAYSDLAVETFNPVLDAMSGFNRSGPRGLTYSRKHDT